MNEMKSYVGPHRRCALPKQHIECRRYRPNGFRQYGPSHADDAIFRGPEQFASSSKFWRSQLWSHPDVSYPSTISSRNLAVGFYLEYASVQLSVSSRRGCSIDKILTNVLNEFLKMQEQTDPAEP